MSFFTASVAVAVSAIIGTPAYALRNFPSFL
jgi:hypothetical protein